MNLEFKEITAEDIEIMLPFYSMRKNKTCDSVFLESFIWKEFYRVRYAVWEGKALLWLMEADGNYFSAMPLCREEDLRDAFRATEEYFNQVLGCPLVIHLADEYAVQYLNLPEEQYVVKELEESRDYLYLGESLRTLSGKKLHKKKNRLNLFLRQNEGRYEYRRLCCSDKEDVWKFLDNWRIQKGEDAEEHLDYEVRGIHDILRNCSDLQIRMGGIYIDDRLEAFSVGSWNPVERMAVIHIEKANPEIPGLYQAINQQFLVHEFPEAEWVNREDDLGIEGLRKAKMSYNPADFARKYLVEQRFGGQEPLTWTESIENRGLEVSLEYLEDGEKGETRELWKECFPEDAKNHKYLDYYYKEKTRDNKLLVKKEGGEILSMLHRNPYELKIFGRKRTADYIVAVGTKKESRGRGHMRDVLTKALRDMNREGRPFTFLMPAAEGIYSPYDFRFIWERKKTELSEKACKELESRAVLEREEDLQLAGEFMERWLRERYQLYTVRDRAYVRRLLRELSAEEGELRFLFWKGRLAGLQGLAGGSQRFLYAGEEWTEEKGGKPGIMGRITNLIKFLPCFSLKEPGEARLCLKVRDPWIPENEGRYLWSLTEKGSALEKVEEGEAPKEGEEVPRLHTDIARLCLWLFGQKKPEELWENLHHRERELLSRVQTIERAFLDEMV